MKFRVLVAGMFSLLLAFGTAYAAELSGDDNTMSSEQFESRFSAPAVSGINGKLELGYLSTDGTIAFPGHRDGAFARAAVSVPIEERFGFQIDGGYASQEGLDTSGVGGHFFWRDPDTALLGIYGHYIDLDTVGSTTRLGGEIEWYHKQWTIEAFAGFDTLNTGVSKSDFFSGEAVAAFYVRDNFRISGGIRRAFGETSALAGFEYLSEEESGVAASIFANAEFGNDRTSVNAGIKIYFGNERKSLIRRHREDDPQIRLDTALKSASLAANANAGCTGELEQSFSAGTLIVNNLKSFEVRPNASVRLLDENLEDWDGCGAVPEGPIFEVN